LDRLWTKPTRTRALLRPGDVVDRYVVHDRIGMGGMAEVWLAVHKQLGSRHALKVLTRASEGLVDRLLLEGRAQAALKHPHIVPVRAILDVRGTPGLLMPLIEGPTLAELCEAHRPTGEQAALLFAQIVAGVGHAHAAGLVHRDLKPSNVLLCVEHGQVVARVADFGLVKEEGAGLHTQQGAVMGTPAYAAPEQLLDASGVGPAADIFSLGVMWVELLTGQRPFAGVSVADAQSARRAPPALLGLSGPERQLAEAMLAEVPGARPDCAGVLQGFEVPGARHPSALALVHAVAQATPSGAGEPTGAAWGAAEPTHNLPQERDSFVGRDDLLTQLQGRLDAGAALITLTGLGGMGKTRLALHFAREQLSSFAGGVLWVDLSDATGEGALAATTARALGVQVARDPARQLGLALQARGRCLVVLDNLEQLIEHGASTLAAWLDATQEAVFLVTSRVPIGLRGESVVPVAPLHQDSAIALFTARAQAANPVFRPDDCTEALRSLVELLDGLPLALELAAARSRTHTVERLLSRMNQRFRLLRSSQRDLPQRHRTLQAALAWSWGLLSQAERATMIQLSVFEGSFQVEAADAVVCLDLIEEAPWVDDVLEALLEHSLLTLNEKGASPRFSMLTSVRAFAAENLDPADAAWGRYAAHFASIAPRGRADTAQAREWLDEVDNLVGAAKAATRLGLGEPAVRCAAAAAEVFRSTGPYLTGAQVVEQVLKAELTPPQRAELHYWRAALRFRLGEPMVALESYAMARDLGSEEATPEARRVEGMGWLGLANVHHERGESSLALREGTKAVELLEQADDLIQLGFARYQLGAMLGVLGRHEASSAQIEATVAIASTPGREVLRLQALGLNLMAGRHKRKGDMEGAERLQLKSIEVAARSRDTNIEMNLAANLRALRGLDTEQMLAEERAALEAWRRMGDDARVGYSAGRVGMAYRRLGRLDEAQEWLHKALHVHRTAGHVRIQTTWLCELAEVALARGTPDEALPLLTEASRVAMPYPAAAADVAAIVVRAQKAQADGVER
jgi:predicted ATPase